jgi:hypothetical protein
MEQKEPKFKELLKIVNSVDGFSQPTVDYNAKKYLPKPTHSNSKLVNSGISKVKRYNYCIAGDKPLNLEPIGLPEHIVKTLTINGGPLKKGGTGMKSASSSPPEKKKYEPKDPEKYAMKQEEKRLKKLNKQQQLLEWGGGQIVTCMRKPKALKIAAKKEPVVEQEQPFLIIVDENKTNE